MEFRSQLLAGRLAMWSHREPLVVVTPLPRLESEGRIVKGPEGVTLPELLVVDPMRALDLAVLVGRARADVPVADIPPGPERQRSGNSVP